MYRLIAATALALIATPAISQDPFDVVCDSTRTFEGISSPPTSVTLRFRIDPVAFEYCYTAEGIECGPLYPMVRMDGNKIVLRDHVEYGEIHRTVLDRSSGTLFMAAGPSLTKGTCRLEPFSGFPKKAF